MGGYGKPTDLFNMVEKGDIDLASTVQGYNPGRFPQSSVMELPLMFQSSVGGHRSDDGAPQGRPARQGLQVKALALYVLPPYPIWTTGKKIRPCATSAGFAAGTPSTRSACALCGSSARSRSAFR